MGAASQQLDYRGGYRHSSCRACPDTDEDKGYLTPYLPCPSVKGERQSYRGRPQEKADQLPSLIVPGVVYIQQVKTQDDAQTADQERMGNRRRIAAVQPMGKQKH